MDDDLEGNASDSDDFTRILKPDGEVVLVPSHVFEGFRLIPRFDEDHHHEYEEFTSEEKDRIQREWEDKAAALEDQWHAS